MSPQMSDAPSVGIGLVGTSLYARSVHAPAYANGRETRLTGVWGRNASAAAEIAAEQGVPVCSRLEELIDISDAVAFAIPAEVQAELAPIAARAGKGLILEKPIARDLEAAERLVDLIEDADVPSQVLLTFRYAPSTETFLRHCTTLKPFGGHLRFVLDIREVDIVRHRFTRDPADTLRDAGTHGLDLLEAALGPIESIRGSNGNGWIALVLEHATGAVSSASFCISLTGEMPPMQVEVYGETGSARHDAVAIDRDVQAGFRPIDIAAEQFAAVMRSGSRHPLDARHGLRIHSLVDAAIREVGA
jgi:predicted dehydrogenase